QVAEQRRHREEAGGTDHESQRNGMRPAAIVSKQAISVSGKRRSPDRLRSTGLRSHRACGPAGPVSSVTHEVELDWGGSRPSLCPAIRSAGGTGLEKDPGQSAANDRGSQDPGARVMTPARRSVTAGRLPHTDRNPGAGRRSAMKRNQAEAKKPAQIRAVESRHPNREGPEDRGRPWAMSARGVAFLAITTVGALAASGCGGPHEGCRVA